MLLQRGRPLASGYKGLLAFGLFSNKIPPVFSSTSFFDYCVKNHPTFSNSDHDYVRYIQVEFRRMLPFEDDNGGKLSYTLNGTLYPDEQVVIYDIGDVKPETEKKRRGRRKKSEIEAEQKEN